MFVSSGGAIMLWSKSNMITSEPATIRTTMSTPNASAQHVVGVVRSGRDVQEKDQVNAHLGDSEHGKAEGNAGPPE
jgi:hypothetical protein